MDYASPKRDVSALDIIDRIAGSLNVHSVRTSAIDDAKAVCGCLTVWPDDAGQVRIQADISLQ
jgi:hypothetical protein